jgi:hypothetical protein
MLQLTPLKFAYLFCVCSALELLVQHRISGFPVIDGNWKLVSQFAFLFSQKLQVTEHAYAQKQRKVSFPEKNKKECS